MASYLYNWPTVPQQPYNARPDPSYYYGQSSAQPAARAPFSSSAPTSAVRQRRVHFEDEAQDSPLSPHGRPIFWPPQTPYTAPGHWSSPGTTVPLPPWNAPPMPPSPSSPLVGFPPPVPMSPYNAPPNGFIYPAPYYGAAPPAYYPATPYAPASPHLPPTSPFMHEPPSATHFPSSPYLSQQSSWPGLPNVTPLIASNMYFPPPPVPSAPVIPGPVQISAWQGDSYVSPNAGLLFSAPPPREQLHPLLSGECIRLETFLDLSHPEFRPMRLTSRHAHAPGFPAVSAVPMAIARSTSSSRARVPPGAVPMNEDDLYQVATQPPLLSMRVTCAALGKWCLEVTPPTGRCVTVGDVLSALHAALRTQIDHDEWAAVLASRRGEVAKSYQRRCKRAGNASPTGDVGMGWRRREDEGGVRRVDFLGEKFVFGGLVRRKGCQGVEEVELLVKAP